MSESDTPTPIEQTLANAADEKDPVEQLRYFCSLTLKPQDWLDVEQLFDSVLAELAAALARAEALRDEMRSQADVLRRVAAERDEARAELARLTTMRPASEHDGDATVIIWAKRAGHDSYRPSHFGTAVGMASHWTPIPTPKEPK